MFSFMLLRSALGNRFKSMSALRRAPYFLTVLTGGTLGFFFGDIPFPELEELLGDPLCDIVMTFGGATLAAIAYEIIAAVVPV